MALASVTGDWTAQQREGGHSTVLAGSAVRRSYRDILGEADPDTFFVHLRGDIELLRQRMAARDHFMPASLLEPQFATLEPLATDERGQLVDVTSEPDEVVVRREAAVRAWQAEGD